MTVMGIVSYKVFPAYMGGQKGVAKFYEYLSKEVETILVTSSDNVTVPFAVKKQYHFLFHHNWGWLNIFYINKLVYLIRQHKIDIIIVEHSYFGIIGILLKAFTGKPFVIHSHNIEAQRFKTAGKFWWKLYEQYERFVHTKANHIFYKTKDDADYANNVWKIKNRSYSIVPFGTDLKAIPSATDKAICRNRICEKHTIQKQEPIFLFNGTLDFEPNIHSIKIIIEELTPLLLHYHFQYKMIICGNRIKEDLLKEINTCNNIIYAGFVDDINIYLKAADAFIVPSSLATGIKTKIIEALANNTLVIADEKSIKGIGVSTAPNKLIPVKSNNYKAFSEAMMKIKVIKNEDTQPSFYDTYYWGNIIHHATLSLQSLNSSK
ncbi:MAG: hypothetical protein C0459_09610 [Chitinophaga sp.]|jgi:polysaccharide biosynthesis protein PslH|nr:hypothetical protein [Chitinophaga sp.]